MNELKLINTNIKSTNMKKLLSLAVLASFALTGFAEETDNSSFVIGRTSGNTREYRVLS